MAKVVTIFQHMHGYSVQALDAEGFVVGRPMWRALELDAWRLARELGAAYACEVRKLR